MGYSCLPQCHAGHSCSNTDVVCSGPTVDLTSVKDGDNKNATPSQNWVKCGEVQLSKKHRIIISSGAWLNDLIIFAAQNLLQSEHPFVGGFQNPVLSEKMAMVPEAGEFIQVLNVGGDHWLTVSNIGCGNHFTIKVFDSLGGRLPTSSKKVVADMLQCQKKSITIIYESVQIQDGASDCGLFALAFATSLCHGNDPSKELYDQEAMRDHLVHSLEEGKLCQFPSLGKRRSRQKAGIQRVPIYCVCRLPDDESEMIQCSECAEWYHTSCVIVDRRVVENRNQKWNCIKC